MPLSISRERTMKIFWLLFFLAFFYTPIKKFNMFSIVITEIQNSSVPLVVVLLELFNVLLVKSRFLQLFLAVFSLLIFVAILLFVSFLISKIFEKVNINKLKFFEFLNNTIEKILESKTAYILLFLFLISLVPRLLYMNAGLFHHDSVETAIATEKTLETGKLYGIVDYRYGYVLLNVIGYSLPYFVFGAQSAELTVNVLTIMIASLSIVIFYLFIRELLNKNYIAFCSALVFSFSPVYFSVTTYAKDHASSILFILLSGYFLLKTLKTSLISYKILFGICLGYSLFIRITDVLVTLPVFFIIYFFPNKFIAKNSDNFKKRFAFKNILTILIIFAIFLILFFIFQKEAISRGISGNKFLENKGYFAHILSVISSLTPFGVFLVAHGFFSSVKKRPYLVWLLFFWILIVLIFYSSFLTARLRFFIPLFIPLSMIIGLELDYLKENFKSISYLALVAVIISMFLLIKPVIEYRNHHSSGKDLALYIANSTEPNSIIIDGGDYGLFYQYYAKRGFIQCPSQYNSTQFDEFIHEVNHLLIRNVSLYFNDRCFDLLSDYDKFRIFDALTEYYTFTPIGDVYLENYETVYSFYKYKFTIYKVKRH